MIGRWLFQLLFNDCSTIPKHVQQRSMNSQWFVNDVIDCSTIPMGFQWFSGGLGVVAFAQALLSGEGCVNVVDCGWMHVQHCICKIAFCMFQTMFGAIQYAKWYFACARLHFAYVVFDFADAIIALCHDIMPLCQIVSAFEFCIHVALGVGGWRQVRIVECEGLVPDECWVWFIILREDNGHETLQGKQYVVRFSLLMLLLHYYY